MIDARTPVLVGVGQVRQRANDPTVAKEPLTLMAEAAELAAEDAGAPDLLAHLDAIRIPHGLWKYGNPGAWLAERFGAASPHTELGQINGTMVLRMLSRSAADIQAGTSDAVLIVGGEAEHSKRRARKAGKRAPRTQLDGPPPDEPMEPYADFGSSAHVQAGLVDPTHCFGLFETALRHRSGLDVDAHRTAVAELWAGFASVAATNPNAWIQTGPSAAEIASPTGDNRVVASPYNKLMVANMVVDQSAAVLLCSAEKARSLGIAEGRWVFPWVCSQGEVGTQLSERFSFDEEPTMGLVGRHTLERSALEPNDLGPIDLYSCFPSAVQLALTEMDLPRESAPTLTGGLTFGGGPFNSYVLHALSQATEILRRNRNAPALVTGVGGFMASHAALTLGGEPREGGFERHELSDRAALFPGRNFVDDHLGAVEIESYVVPHRDNTPHQALVAARTPEGHRCWAQTQDSELLGAMVTEEFCGRSGTIGEGRELVVS